ncbi:SGNH/GDSL hydrolase family protein [Cohnella fermenti]|uniref:SGNH/GDSL hydrolase family protein n=1 Tax=Cohnella fermenti TaxID=2565925 RepID=A0A4S4BL08_9BACL|nr:SGNH/GDSL hydrolase family protein [Cohnella fermenti]THF74830.1 SGNH/GDSL hydrolase family protein [Cohnella fermenti]
MNPDWSVARHRGPLVHTRRALEKGRLTVGYAGGSITEYGPSAHNWPEPVHRWLSARYPQTRIYVENAAIGATGSDLMLFRAERDLIGRGCDLIFLEYAVNDGMTPADRRMRTREGLIRKLLAGGTTDLVIVYTYSQRMYESMMRGEIPDSIREFELLAEHYGIGSVWVGLHALREVQAGLMTWDEWLPDGLHPTHRGSWSYAQAVMEFISAELDGKVPASGGRSFSRKKAASSHIPPPYMEDSGQDHAWANAALVPFEQVELEGSWLFVRPTAVLPWTDCLLCTSALGSKMSFSFAGTRLALGFDFGKRSAEFVYRIDDGEPVQSSRERPAWCGDGGWFQLYWVGGPLERGLHRVEIEVVHGNREECGGTRFHLGLIGVIP